MLQQTPIKNSLKYLHSKFVIAPIDKASNNVSFICKRFYAHILVNELGLRGSINPDSTYEQVKKGNTENIINKHIL